jgi:hypothetical protein
MPVPSFSGLPPFPTFEDHSDKINKLVQELRQLLLNLDSLNIKSLTADKITAGTIDANIVTIRSDLTAGAYIQIDGNGMVINNGTIDTFRADINGNVTATGMTIRNDLLGNGYVQLNNNGLVINNGLYDTFRADINGNVTMTSALIQSAAGYPRVVMDPSNTLLGAYRDSSNYIEIRANYLGSPGINVFESGTMRGQIVSRNNDLTLIATTNLVLSTAAGNVKLAPATGYLVEVDNWSELKSTNQSQTLQEALNAKANYFTGISGTVYVATTSGGPANKAITFSNGIRTS